MANFGGVGAGLTNAAQLYQQAINQQLERKRFEQQSKEAQQRIDIEKQARADEASRWQEQLKLEHQKLDAEHELQKTNQQLLLGKIAEAYQNYGYVPPGGTVTPGAGPAAPAMDAIPALGLPATQAVRPPTNILSIPGIGEMEVATPEELTRRAVAKEEAIEGPKRESARILQGEEADRQEKVQAAEGERRLKEIAAQGAQRLIEIGKNHEYETTRQNNQIAAEKALAQMHIASQLQIARLNATGGLMDFGGSGSPGSGIHVTVGSDGAPQINSTSQNSGNLIENTMQQIRDGQISSDELKKRFPKQSPFLEGLATQRGISPLTKDQQSSLKDLNDVAKAVPLIRQMAEIRSQSGNTWVPGTESYKAFESASDQLAKYIPSISRVLSNVRRLNTNEVDLNLKSLIPSKAPWKGADAGIQKYNDFVTSLQNDFNTATNTLPKTQQDYLRGKLGYNDFPYLNKAMINPGAPTGSPQGATSPNITQPQPQQNLIHVIRKSDGIEGTIDPKDFDPNKYSTPGDKNKRQQKRIVVIPRASFKNPDQGPTDQELSQLKRIYGNNIEVQVGK